MKNILLGIIAINLTFISANLALKSVEPVQAQLSVYQVEDAVQDALEGCHMYAMGSPERYYFNC